MVAVQVAQSWRNHLVLPLTRSTPGCCHHANPHGQRTDVIPDDATLIGTVRTSPAVLDLMEHACATSPAMLAAASAPKWNSTSSATTADQPRAGDRVCRRVMQNRQVDHVDAAVRADHGLGRLCVHVLHFETRLLCLSWQW
jgi:hypothetical protein